VWFIIVQNYPQFWPSELCSETQYGPLTVELLEYDDNPYFVSRCFRIRKVRIHLEIFSNYWRTINEFIFIKMAAY
jgi:hypothetical protein